MAMLKMCFLGGIDDNDPEEDTDLSFLLSVDYSQVKWKKVGLQVALNVAAVAGWLLFLQGYVCWPTVLWNFLLGFISIVGVTVGAHDLWSRRIYDTIQPFKLFLLVAQTIASQDRVWIWVRDDRQHCRHKGTDADPFNSKRGFFFSHVGWLMMKRHPDVIAKGKQPDLSDLEVDSLVMFQKRHYVAMYILLALLQLTIPCYFWDEMFEMSFIAFIARVVTVLHINWCIHSLQSSNSSIHDK